MKADLHLHTNFSFDAISSPKEVVNSAIEKGMDCICVTDHGEVNGAVEAMKFGFDKNILVIPGIEVLTKSGDVLGINVKKIIPDGLSIEQTIEEIQKQGGIAVVPHPFNWPVGGFVGGRKKLLNLMIDAIEVFNSSMVFNFLNKRASTFSKIHNFSFTAGSDAHRADFIGRGYVEFSHDIRSEKDVLEAIKNKQVRVGGRALSLFEKLKNGSQVSVKDIIDYYRLKPYDKRKKR